MSFCSTKNCLHYASPAHGGWGVVRVGMLLPESHQLFVCPFACGRHGAIGAIQQGFKDRLSYLYISQSDIIDGYEDLIIDSIDELISKLNNKVKAILIFVSCLDDLIGTDTQSVKEYLNKKYKEIDFQFCHMNPITADTKLPPLVHVQKNLYEMLKKGPKNNKQILTLGNLEVLEEKNDFKQFLQSNGYSLKHISETQTYEEFQSLSQSFLSIVLAPSGLASAKMLKEQLDIPYLFLPTAYSFKEIREQYNKICEYLNLSIKADYFKNKEHSCIKLIQKALSTIDNKKIILANSATNRVFSLALNLISFGFNVDTIYAQSCPKIEKNAKKEIEENYTNVKIKQVIHHSMIQREIGKADYIAIGIEGAYAINSRYPVQFEGDHKIYGYQGIEKLMTRIIDSIENPKTIEELLDIYKLVI